MGAGLLAQRALSEKMERPGSDPCLRRVSVAVTLGEAGEIASRCDALASRRPRASCSGWSVSASIVATQWPATGGISA